MRISNMILRGRVAAKSESQKVSSISKSAASTESAKLAESEKSLYSAKSANSA